MSALRYVEGVKSGDITAEEFVAATLERIRRHDGRLHAYLDVYEDAVDRARAVDKRVRAGQRVGACYGLPISAKDNICVRDARTTCASRMLEDFVAPYDATAVSRLRSEDAVLVGKTNLDEFAMGITTEFSAYGPSRNPWNTDYVPGGSSGGSAVAVASGLCVASLGSDTGGSVRNPASFCGVVGYKPTYGLVSRYGLISYANSIEQIGTLTRTVGDAALLLNIISGRDHNDDTTTAAAGGDGGDGKGPDYLDGLDSGIEGKTFGIVREMLGGGDTGGGGGGADSAVVDSARRAASRLEGLGASCREISLDMVDYSVAAYYTITATEAGSNLARYDNIRYGFDLPSEGYEFNSYISRARSRLGPEVIRRMILGGFVPSAGHAGRYFLKALKVKNRLAREVGKAFESVDFMLSPTVPVLPFRMGSKIDDPVALFLVDINTVTANLTGSPAVSVPFDLIGGLPVGMQIMGRPMDDGAVLRAAHALQGTVSLPEVPL